MRTPSAKQLPSGSWRIQYTDSYGKRRSLTLDARSKADAERQAASVIFSEHHPAPASEKTLRSAAEEYIELRGPALSPSSVRGYRIILNTRLQLIADTPIGKLNERNVQLAVNNDMKHYSPKSIKSAWGFYSSVIRHAGGPELHPRLPQPVPYDKQYLQPEQIPDFLSAVKDKPCEVPALLALHGLRASEIMDLHWHDVTTTEITVHGSAVPDEFNILTHKATNKNSTSHRTVPVLIPRLAELISGNDCPPDKLIVTVSTSGAIYNAINRCCEKSGLPAVGIHGLRHSFVSLCYHLQVPEAMAMQLGGYSDIMTMRKIYTHLSESDKQKHVQQLAGFFK